MLIVPPDIYIALVGRVEVKPREGEVAHPPAVQMLRTPLRAIAKLTALADVRRPATFVVPPSKVNDAPVPAPMTLVPTVPMFIVPADTHRPPLLVGEPFCPMTVAFASNSRKPPVAGMV